MRGRIINIIIQVCIVLALLVIVNLIANKWYGYLDLTEDKRFTLEKSTENLISDIEDRIFVEVLLDGELNSSFIQLRSRTEEILKQFRNVNSNIEYQFTNPSRGTVDEINLRRENYRKDGIYPTTLFIFENDQRVEKQIYPYAIVSYGDRRIPVNLLEPIARGENEEEAINRSSMLLEYKLTSSIAKLISKGAKKVLFTEGNGELEEQQTAMLETLLAKTMLTGRINLDSVYRIDPTIDLLIVARPMQALSERSQFIIDQYLMNGGKIIWLIDQFLINLDSINNNKVYVPRPIEHGLDNMFFKYGVRINKDLILDLENTKIPQVFGVSGGRAQQQLFSWVFHPLLLANPDNPIVKNIDRVYSTFPSTIEVLEREDLNSEVLLTSSQYSRFQIYPSINISFEILRLEQRTEAYNKSYLPAAVMLEGEFDSYFKNRVSESMMSGLSEIGASFKERSNKTQQVFISDSDIIKNLYDSQSNRISPMGFNKWEAYTYEGNEDFIINTIDYLLDDYGLVASRSKNYRLRLLNQVELQECKLKWQIINLLFPTLMILLFGVLYVGYRKRKYTS